MEICTKMTTPQLILTVYAGLLVFMSIVTLIVFAVDKKKSTGDGGRIPEMVLLSLMTFGGSLGGLIGMYGLRHKTNFKTKFHFGITVWMSLVIQAAVAVLLVIAAF